MEESTGDLLVANIREALAYRSGGPYAPVKAWYQDEILLGHRPLCNDHSVVSLFIEHDTLKLPFLEDVARGVFHDGASLTLPVLFSPETLAAPTSKRLSDAIREFRGIVLDMVEGQSTRILVLNDVLTILPNEIVVAMAAGQLPAIPATVRMGVSASHQLLHATGAFAGHRGHDEKQSEFETVADQWIRTLREKGTLNDDTSHNR